MDDAQESNSTKTTHVFIGNNNEGIMSKLQGKVALVTGAGQGVGQGIAFALSALGATVAVTGRTLSKCETTVKEIQKRGGKALAIECDVKNADSLKSSVDEIVKKLGGLNILINNAQEVPLGDLFSVTDDAINAGWESGPLATFRLMKLCYPHLKGNGCIVNLATTASMRWDASNYGAYAAVKEGIRALTRAAACEWGKDGIRTNVILPFAKSPGLASWFEAVPDEAAAFLATVPLRYAGDCEEDIGRFVAVLCTDDSRYINGQTIGVDGGQAFLG
jgi:meso-butanediol dehydrogenase / (S,S)-butanediol dehydrogenase / diacetyl reductase